MKYAPPIGQEAQGEDAHYIDGNPELGILGSPVPAAAIEQGQRELLHVIKQAGLTPDEATLTQLYEAILKIIGAQVPVASKTETGLVQIGDGLKVTPEGLLSVLTATAAQAGILRPDGTTCRVQDGVLSVPTQANEGMEAWRTSWIGVPRYWRSTALPPNHCWANGDFVAFADWPELKAVYEAGGFEGMLLPWDADGDTQAANLGQWRPDAAEPTGLFTPNLTGQFFRNWGPGADKEAGAWGRDEIRNITGALNHLFSSNDSAPSMSGAFRLTSSTRPYRANQAAQSGTSLWISFAAANVVPTGVQNVPQHVWQPVILYLGQPATSEEAA